MRRPALPYYFFTIGIAILIAVCSVIPIVPIFAQSIDDIQNAFVKSLPVKTELPQGWSWKSGGILRDGGLVNEGWITDRHFLTQTVYEYLNLAQEIRYLAKPISVEDLKTTRHGTTYTGIANSVIKSGYGDCEISFLINNYIVGIISMTHYIGDIRGAVPINLPNEPDRNAFIRAEVDRLAKLVWSRLPKNGIPVSGTSSSGQKSTDQSSGQSSSGQSSTGQSTGTSSGTIPDTALPIATGAAAGLLALGTWLTMLTSGVPVKESFSDLISLFSPNKQAAPQTTSVAVPIENPVAIVTEAVIQESTATISPEEHAKEDAAYKQAFSDFKGERAQYKYTSEDSNRNLAAEAKAEADAQSLAEQENIIGIYDKLVFESFITDQAPGQQARKEMMEILNANLNVQREDGSYIGSQEKIRSDLTDYLHRAREADKSIFSCDEIDIDFVEKLEIVQEGKSGIVSESGEAMSTVKDYIDSPRDPAGFISELKDLADKKELILSPEAQGLVDDLRKKTEFFDSNALDKVSEKMGYVQHALDVVDYQAAYKLQGLGEVQAMERALERKAIEIAVDKGVDKIPILKMADTIGSKGGELLFGKDLGSKNLFTFLSQRAANYVHGDYTTYTPEFINDAAFQQRANESSINALEKLIEVSSGADKVELQSMLNQLRGAGS